MWIVYTALGIAGIDIATAKQYGSIQGSWECINRSFTSCDILCKCLLMNVRLDHSILISLPLVHDHKYVISLTVLIHTITSAGSVWQINAKSATASLIANLRVLQLASLSKSPTTGNPPHMSQSSNISFIIWQGRSPAGSYSSGPTYRMVNLVPTSVGTRHCHRLSLCSWPNK